MKLLKPIVVTVLTLFILAYFLPSVNFGHWTTLVIAAVVLTLLNKIAFPILKLLFLPINIVTLGLFNLLLNASMLWLATYLVPGFQISNLTVMGYDLNQFFTLLFVSVLLGLLQGLIALIL